MGPLDNFGLDGARMSKGTSTPPLTPICNIVTPVGMLGYGLHEDQTALALSEKLRNGAPTALILDSGSTDSGPEKLALGNMSVPRDSYVRDLTKLIRLALRFKVPLIFSSAGGDGTDEHVKELCEIVREIIEQSAKTSPSPLKVLSVYSSIPKSLVSQRLEASLITPCGTCVPPLLPFHIDAVPVIVAQMGPEPLLDAMLAHPDFSIMIAGRAYDPAPYIAFAAFASHTTFNDTMSLEAQRLWGGFAHMGKILECGGACAVPKTNGACATVYEDGSFDVVPLDKKSRCTAISVAAHTLYEKSRPDILFGPGGSLDLNGMETEVVGDGRNVRVRGGIFRFERDEGRAYTVKLEGAEVVGWRTQFMGSFKDPILINQVDNFLLRVKDYVATQHIDAPDTWELDFHIYGQHSVSTLPLTKGQPAEIFIVGESLASTQELATSICSVARIACVHGPYPSQKATSGNLAYGLGGKMHMELGPCAQFCIYHLLALEPGEERLSSVSPNGLFSLHCDEFSMSDSPTPPSSPPTTSPSSPRTSAPSFVPIAPHTNPKTLGDVASLLRSKNAGPYEITLDVLFPSVVIYNVIKDCGLLTRSSMATLFEISEEEVLWCGFFDKALAWKVTVPRKRKGKGDGSRRVMPSGGFMESDVHGSQMYIGLMNLELSGEVRGMLGEE